MSDNYLKDLFIDEVKGALKGSSSGGGGDTSALEATMNQKFAEVNAKIDGIQIGGRNLLLGSENIRMIAVYGATINYETGIAITEWGADNAIRATGTGGTNTAFGILANTPATISITGQKYIASIYVKNNGENTITVRFIMPGLVAIQILPGEVRKIEQAGVGNGVQGLQFNLSTSTAGETFDLTYWHPKIEEGTIATAWTPAPEDLDNALSSISASLDEIGADVDSNKILITNITSVNDDQDAQIAAAQQAADNAQSSANAANAIFITSGTLTTTVDPNASGKVRYDFPVALSDDNYFVSFCPLNTCSDIHWALTDRSNTGFSLYMYNTGAGAREMTFEFYCYKKPI